MHRDKPTRCACGGWASGLGVNESHFGQVSSILSVVSLLQYVVL